MQTNTIGYLQGNASELIHSCALALSKQEWWIKHRTTLRGPPQALASATAWHSQVR